MTEHKHAGFLRAIADGEPMENWEYHSKNCTEWVRVYPGDVSKFIADPDIFFIRRKPRTIRIGDMDVPEPMRIAPAIGSLYWLVSAASGSTCFTWLDSALDKCWLSFGVIHTTEEAAEQHRRALILVSGGTP